MPLRKLEQLFENYTRRKYNKRQMILFAGDKLTNVYFMRRGYAKLYSINEQGEERILMIFPPNTAFPIIPNLLNNEPYTLKYFYEAMTDVEAYQMSIKQFGNCLEQNEEASQLVLEYVTNLAGELVRRLGIIENKDAANKLTTVMAYLLKVCSAEVAPNKYKVDLKLTHHDISCLAGLARETTSLQLKQMEKGKIIEQSGNGRLIINAKLLARTTDLD